MSSINVRCVEASALHDSHDFWQGVLRVKLRDGRSVLLPVIIAGPFR